MKANEEIDIIQQVGVSDDDKSAQVAKGQQSEQLRIQVAKILRQLEQEIELNKF